MSTEQRLTIRKCVYLAVALLALGAGIIFGLATAAPEDGPLADV